MFFRILKKDLKRKKTMNIILLIFIILVTTFLASSVNNLIAVLQSVDYFMDKAKAPDYVISAIDRGDNGDLVKWLDSSKLIKSYEVQGGIILSKDKIKIKKDEKLKKFESVAEDLLQAQPKKYGKLLDDNGEEIKLNIGEIAISLPEKSKNKLKVGDKIVITVGDIRKEFIIKTFTKDAIFSSSMNNFQRILISKEDYEKFKGSKEAGILNNYNIMSDDTNTLDKELRGMNFNTMYSNDKSLIRKSFILDTITFAVLIVVSFCLILISFLILRFTIIFTLQDDFKEIGVMKAIGLKEFDIRKIYLIKYLVITIVGVLIGFILSFPFGNAMLKQAEGNILMKPSTGNMQVNAACAVMVVLIVIIFCYTCTRKLNKFSAIDAIRNGSSGESFKGKSKVKLKRCKKLGVPMFIALNDIISNIKRFSVQILIYCIGTILIVIPLNTINTIKDGNIVKTFGLQYSDVFIETNKIDQYTVEANKEQYLKDMSNLEKSFKDRGVDIKIHGEVIYGLNFYVSDKDNTFSLLALQAQGSDTNNYNVLKGKMPQLINEVAITETVAKRLNVNIGDTIHAVIGNEAKELIVTGLYESMTNMGQSVRLNPKINVDFKYLTMVQPFQGNFKAINKSQDLQKNNETEVLINKLREKYPAYSFKNPQEFLSRYMGSTLEQLDRIKNLIVLIVLAINALITVLMMKTYITKEKGEIAMLKNIGFRNSAIRFWQSARISIVLIVSIILGIIASKFLGPITAGQAFSKMGVHNIVFKVKAIEVYLAYPTILLIINTVIAYLSTRAVIKVDLKEINNVE
ncbi:ABC transporter permease [Clostridium manihotivorum]|uniref:ABC3 transporter permease C-terminal domain-containing protein n=1 Tax=Clostridium manihotivorum TaxID=2320868 RepID=A0A410DT60_9CLOT|nr:ABC transporter permease [Clostridium manihotivorum]QAA32259.1 hypothetical protein C1I91_11750 [Clostridium manihotivorum]